jgi:hypothetical protein
MCWFHTYVYGRVQWHSVYGYFSPKGQFYFFFDINLVVKSAFFIKGPPLAWYILWRIGFSKSTRLVLWFAIENSFEYGDANFAGYFNSHTLSFQMWVYILSLSPHSARPQYCGHTNQLRKCQLKKLGICSCRYSNLDFRTSASVNKIRILCYSQGSEVECSGGPPGTRDIRVQCPLSVFYFWPQWEPNTVTFATDCGSPHMQCWTMI